MSALPQGARRALRACAVTRAPRQVPGGRAVLRVRTAAGRNRDRRANVGDLVVVRPGTAAQSAVARGRAIVARRLGRPDVARDVIEALMIDRGLRRGFDPAVEHEARDAASALDPSGEALRGAGRRDLRSLPTFTIDPVSARDFDDAISAAAAGRRLGTGLGPHRRRLGVRAARGRSSTARPTGAGRACTCPARSSRCCPTALSNDACSLVPGQDRADGHGRAGDRRRAGALKQPSTAR